MSTDSSAYSLAPTLLLSMPQLRDPNFERSVVLLCRHNAEGAFGLVINRPMPEPSRVSLRDDPTFGERELLLWEGGPVEPERTWILLEHPVEGEEALEVSGGLYLSTSAAALSRLIQTSDPRSRLFVGYAGWAPGQLEFELKASAWLTVNVELDLVFDVPAEKMWETAIRRLGADPTMLQMSQGVH